MSFWQITAGDVLGSGLATALLGTFLTFRNARLAAEVKHSFDERMLAFTGTRAFQQAALYELFGPLKMQFARTKRAYKRWKGRNDHIEGQVVRRANEAARDLLLTKGHLIPPDLMDGAERLIEHYDAWLEKYEELRVLNKDDATFVFVGPDGYGFPRDAERSFCGHAEMLQKELFGAAVIS